MDEWGAAAIGGSIVAVLGGIGLLIERLYKVRGQYTKETLAEQRRADADQRKADATMLEEYKELLETQKKEIRDTREQIHDLRDEMQEISNELAICKAGRARADERIAALEDALTAEGIPHRKWEPDNTGSNAHRPLTSQEILNPFPKRRRSPKPETPPNTNSGETDT